MKIHPHSLILLLIIHYSSCDNKEHEVNSSPPYPPNLLDLESDLDPEILIGVDYYPEQHPSSYMQDDM